MAQKMQNGIHNLDDKEMEEMRKSVIQQELSARSWRAMLTKMQDTIAISKLEEEYDVVVKANAEKIRAQQQAFNDMVNSLKEEGNNLEIVKD